nr:MAG TPA: hypothetical protein [Caudoviricetes sp.]
MRLKSHTILYLNSKSKNRVGLGNLTHHASTGLI